MRPSLWVSLMFFVVLAIGIHAHSSSRPAARAQAGPPAANAPSWVVEGKWMKSREEAIDSALEQARAEVVAYLRIKDQRLEWMPPVDFIRAHLLADLTPEEVPQPEAGPRGEARALRPIHHSGHQVLEDEKDFQDLNAPLGRMRKVHLKVTLDPGDYNTIQKMDCEYRQQQRQILSQQRQVFLAKVLAGVVAVLVAVAGYFRLEEATKGYYTGWLRLAAVGLVAAVVAGLLLVA